MTLTKLRDELPPEGDEAEAREILRQRPLELPTYKLERVHVATLNVDYAPPHGTGYARPLSQYRLAQLRRDWDPLAVSPLTISRRPDNTLWVIDGNHRRFVGWEKGMHTMPAMVHSGLERAREADLYTKLGTVLGQTPWTRFQAKLASGDENAQDIVKIALRFGVEVNGASGGVEGKIQAVARVEWIYARSGPDGLNWVLGVLVDAYGGDRESLSELALEGVFGFYVRYADRVERGEVSDLLRASGIVAWLNRADAINAQVDVGPRGHSYGMAIVELVNDTRRRRGAPVKNLLPAWERVGNFGSRLRDVSYTTGRYTQWKTVSARGNLAPQQLGVS